MEEDIINWKTALQTVTNPLHVYQMVKMGQFVNPLRSDFFGRSYLRG